MPLFGQYRTVREIQQDGRATVYSAVVQGDDPADVIYDQLATPEEFILKAVRRTEAPRRGTAPDDRADAPAESVPGYVERARVQRRLNNAGARHWALLVDTGAYDQGVYFVYPSYPESAASLVRRGRDVTHGELLAVVQGVSEGLDEIRKVSNRPHGNLKPSNVLLRDIDPIRRDAVSLTDPAPDAVAHARGEGADLVAVGRLIYELVFRRPYNPPADDFEPAVPLSHEWSRLGRHGEAWRALCARLLRAGPGNRKFALANLAGALRTLAPRRRLLRPRTLAFVLVLLGVPGIFLGFQYVRYQREWAALCAGYGDGFASLAEGYNAADSAAAQDRQDLTQDSHLRDAVLNVLAGAKADGVDFDPRILANAAPSTPPAELKDHPPLTLSAALQTRKAYAAVRKIEDELTPARWDALRRMEHRAETYQDHNWPHLAAFAADALAGLPRSPDAVTPPSADRAHPGGTWAALVAFERASKLLDQLDAARDAARVQLQAITDGMAPVHNLSTGLAAVVEPEQDSLKEAVTTDAPDAVAASIHRRVARIDLAARTGEHLSGSLPLLIELTHRQTLFASRGWVGPATALARVVEQFLPIADPAEARPPLQQAVASADAIERAWDAIQARRKLIDASGDALLATYGRFVTQSLDAAAQAEELPPLLEALNRVNDDADWNAAAAAVATATNESSPGRLPPADSPAHVALTAKLQRTPAAVADREDVRHWLDDAKAARMAAVTVAATPDATTRLAATTTSAPTSAPVIASTNPTRPPAPTTTAPAVASTNPVRPTPTTTAPVAVVQGTSATTPATPVTRPVPIVEDPRADWHPEGPLAFLRDQDWVKLQQAGLVDNLGLPQRPAAEDDKEADALRDRIAGVAAMAKRVRNLPLTADGRANIDQQIRSVDGQIETLRSDVNKALRERRAAMAAADRLKESLEAFTRDCNGEKLDAPPEIADQWAESNANFAGRAAKVPKALEALAAERQTLRQRLERLTRAYADSATPATMPADGRAAETLAAALQAELRSRRAAALRDVLALAAKPGLTAPKADAFDAALAAMRTTVADARAEAASLVADAADARRLLEQGFTPDEVNGGPSARQRLARHSGDELLRVADIAAAWRPFTAPLDALDAAKDRAALRPLAGDSAQPLGLRRAAWLRLANLPAGPTPPYPADRAELADDQTLVGQLRAAAASIQYAAARDRQSRAIDDEARRQWERFVASTADGNDLAAALAARPAFAADAARLDARSRFNLALLELRQHTARPAVGTLTAEQGTALVAAVQSAADDLPAATRQRGDVAALLSNLRQWSADAGPPDFSRLGPLSPDLAQAQRVAGLPWAWNLDTTDNGNVLTYRRRAGTLGRPAAELAFRKVDRPDAEGGPIYLGTTEVTVRTFDDVLTAAGKWPEVKRKKLLWDYTPRPDDNDSLASLDDRKGPRSWVWKMGGPEVGIDWPVTWLSFTWVGREYGHYFPGDAKDATLVWGDNSTIINPPPGELPKAVNPSALQPMQYVSADAAAYFAKAVGCRLPTPTEWKAVYAREMEVKEAKEKPLRYANLRDHTWRLQFLYNRSGGQGRVPPDAGMFRPAGEQETGQVYAQSSALYSPDKDYRDGLLFFREATTGGSGIDHGGAETFHHLAGNVAEFVQDESGKMFVIGGSALSPPSRQLDKAYEVDATAKGFSDVGFRLLLPGPPKATDRLANAVGDGGWYLK